MGKHRVAEVIDVEPVEVVDEIIDAATKQAFYMQYSMDQVVGLVPTTSGLVPALVAAHPLIAHRMNTLLEALNDAFGKDTWDMDLGKLEAVGEAYVSYLHFPQEFSQSTTQPNEVD